MASSSSPSRDYFFVDLYDLWSLPVELGLQCHLEEARAYAFGPSELVGHGELRNEAVLRRSGFRGAPDRVGSVWPGFNIAPQISRDGRLISSTKLIVVGAVRVVPQLRVHVVGSEVCYELLDKI